MDDPYPLAQAVCAALLQADPGAYKSFEPGWDEESEDTYDQFSFDGRFSLAMFERVLKNEGLTLK